MKVQTELRACKHITWRSCENISPCISDITKILFLSYFSGSTEKIFRVELSNRDNKKVKIEYMFLHLEVIIWANNPIGTPRVIPLRDMVPSST